MTRKLFALTIVGVIAALAAFGLVRDRTVATSDPLPIQPFDPQVTITLGSGQLDWGPPATVAQTTYLTGDWGTRYSLPMLYSPKGFRTSPDMDITDGTLTGSVTSTNDLLCDGVVDVLGKAGAPPILPEDYYERTTNVDPHPGLGDDDEDYVRYALPPWEHIWRERADLTTLYIGGEPTFPYPLVPPVPLNITNLAIPWQPGAAVSNVMLTGAPSPPSNNCIDTEATSTSETTTELVTNPASGGDAGGPQASQSELHLHGLWPLDASTGDSIPNVVNVAVGGSTTITMHKELVNQGPEVGSFEDMWVVEEPIDYPPVAPGIKWVGVGADICTLNGVQVDCSTAPKITDLHVSKDSVAVGSTVVEERDLELSCPTGSDGTSYILAVKNIAWPKAGTSDNDLQDNVALAVIQLNCGDVSGLTEVEKSVVMIDAPHYVALAADGSTTITVREINANHSNADVDTEEWFDAETSGAFAGSDFVPDLDLRWDPVVDDICTYLGGVVTCATAPEITDLHRQVVNPGTGGDTPRETNQSELERDLDITCTQEGVFPLVIKKVLAPKSTDGWIEGANLIDNAMYHVVTVSCGLNPDEIDDAAGLYTRWTTFTAQMDWRRSLSVDAAGNPISPPTTANPGDIHYYERVVRLNCFYIGPAGTVNQNEWSAWETSLGVTIDQDQDCLQNAATAQPGHAVDPDDDPTDNSDCPAIVYSESGGSIQVQYNQAADMDCDGLLDGIEMAWGSNPLDADTDHDGASDFDEMFEFTNPLDPDSDDDGLLDKPEDDYEAQAAGGNETGETANLDDNCPTLYNPGQENNDGLGHSNGLLGGTTGVMGNFYGDTDGDICDTDDDNDGVGDAAELLWDDKGYGTCELDPFDIDSDGDHRADGPEHRTGKDPCVSDSPPASLTVVECKGGYSANVNVPLTGAFGGLWDAENDGDEDNREEDADDDGKLNCQDPVDDDDSDAPNFGYAGAEITDVVEVRGYNTYIAIVDTDGDGCPDWQEIADINGDGAANILDVQISAQCNLGHSAAKGCQTSGGSADSLYVADINKDGANNILDVQLTALNTLAKGGMPVCSSNQAGANHGQR